MAFEFLPYLHFAPRDTLLGFIMEREGRHCIDGANLGSLCSFTGAFEEDSTSLFYRFGKQGTDKLHNLINFLGMAVQPLSGEVLIPVMLRSLQNPGVACLARKSRVEGRREMVCMR